LELVDGVGFLLAGIGKKGAFGCFATEIISSWNLICQPIMIYEYIYLPYPSNEHALR
jgi:hypothetical protein